jgi:hypothetical protein
MGTYFFISNLNANLRCFSQKIAGWALAILNILPACAPDFTLFLILSAFILCEEKEHSQPKKERS